MLRAHVRRPGSPSPLWLRALIALWGVWFTTALTEPAGMFACQVHSGMAGAYAGNGHSGHGSAAAATEDARALDAQVAHLHNASATSGESHGQSHRSNASRSSTPERHDCCTCLGQCCTAPPASMRVQVPTLAVAAVRDEVRAEFADVAHVPLLRAHALPYANGPPLTA